MKLDFDVDDMIEEIRKLEVQDYLRCQIDSKNHYFLMFSFIKKIKEYVVFIKLSIIEKETGIVCVISFHEALINELSSKPFKEE